MEMQEEKKLCEGPGCLKILDPAHGRPDRRFCSDVCRSAFHNKKRQQQDSEIIRVNRILELNFEILQDSLGEEKSVSIARETLLRRGFSFDYYTQVNGDYKFCYTYGYTSRKEKYILIVRGFDAIVKKE
jgi:predicted nucleic acid-binding Zn ribbon protein